MQERSMLSILKRSRALCLLPHLNLDDSVYIARGRLLRHHHIHPQIHHHISHLPKVPKHLLMPLLENQVRPHPANLLGSIGWEVYTPSQFSPSSPLES